jgi:DNA-directed RNA polymerase subunit RPC12/RpoP
MDYTCRDCKRTFGTELELDLHRDNCDDGQLICRVCGERFAEADGTDDGWHYRCPDSDCGGSGIGDDIHRVTDIRLEAT